MIESGAMTVGDAVVILPSNKGSRVKSILGPGGWINAAARGDSITVILEDEVDMTRGDVLAAPGDLPHVASIMPRPCPTRAGRGCDGFEP